jgi:uncharacterized membrane protein YphA (DoxX/SURF4 family)
MAQPERGLNVAAWVASALLCALFLYAGPPKWRGADQPVEMFHQFGYSDGFRVFIGVCETIGGIALLFPNFAFWAACGLFIIMGGAVYSHLSNDQAGLVGAPLLAAAMLAFVA